MEAVAIDTVLLALRSFFREHRICRHTIKFDFNDAVHHPVLWCFRRRPALDERQGGLDDLNLTRHGNRRDKDQSGMDLFGRAAQFTEILAVDRDQGVIVSDAIGQYIGVGRA